MLLLLGGKGGQDRDTQEREDRREHGGQVRDIPFCCWCLLLSLLLSLLLLLFSLVVVDVVAVVVVVRTTQYSNPLCF